VFFVHQLLGVTPGLRAYLPPGGRLAAYCATTPALVIHVSSFHVTETLTVIPVRMLCSCVWH